MRLQALALADALAAARHPKARKPAGRRAKTPQDFLVAPPPLCRYLPRLSQIWPVAALDRMLTSGCTALPDGQEFPDILITCGRRMAGLSIAMRRLARYHGAPTRTIHIQDPRLPAHYFDILIVPQHDPTRGRDHLHGLTEPVNHAPDCRCRGALGPAMDQPSGTMRGGSSWWRQPALSDNRPYGHRYGSPACRFCSQQ